MKYDITYACGHTQTVQLYGCRQEREQKIRSLSYQLCPECLYEEHKKEAKKAKREADALGLPDLVGTEKQITWAETLRQKFIQDSKDCLQKNLQYLDQLPLEKQATIRAQVEQNIPLWHAAVQQILQENTASFWIDSRSIYCGRLIADKIKKLNQASDNQCHKNNS